MSKYWLSLDDLLRVIRTTGISYKAEASLGEILLTEHSQVRKREGWLGLGEFAILSSVYYSCFFRDFGRWSGPD